MRSKILLSFFLLLLSLSASVPSRAQSSPTSQYDDLGSNSSRQTKLSFRLHWGYLVIVQGSIGDVHNLNFLVDTGASPSVVDLKLSRSLGLAPQPARVTLSGTSVSPS